LPRGFLGGQFFGQGTPFRLGFQAAEFLQCHQRVLGHGAKGKASRAAFQAPKGAIRRDALLQA
jgi:hypothetical protein